MPVKVLHLVHAFRTGGAERVLVNLINHASFEVTNIVGSFFEPDEFCEEIHENKRDVRWLEKRPGQDWRVVWRLVRLIRREKVHIVHSLGWGTYLEGLLACRLSGLPPPRFIYAFHGKTIEDVRDGVPWKRRLAQRVAACFTDAVIAPSSEMATDYARTIGLFPDSV